MELLSILTAIRKASTGTLHAVLGTVLGERHGLITENPHENNNNVKKVWFKMIGFAVGLDGSRLRSGTLP